MLNGYLYTIEKGLEYVRNVDEICRFKGSKKDEIKKLKKSIDTAEAIIIGAGSGLSTSAGLTYSGERFDKYFSDFKKLYGINDMYSGGFYPFSSDEIRWAWWARHIYYNRYINPDKPVYNNLFDILRDKNYFVITTNVDHQFQRAGFNRDRLFYTQGDYGLFQSVNSDNLKTYDNEDWVMKAMEAQGFVRDEYGIFQITEKGVLMSIPTDLIPKCPDDNSDVVMNLRADDTFLEDAGWKTASMRYFNFIKKYDSSSVLFLELGVGDNTPVIIKYPFWQMTDFNKKAIYACINYKEAFYPKQLKDRQICIDDDIGDVIKQLKII